MAEASRGPRMLTHRDGAISEMMDDLAQDDAGLRRSLADIRLAIAAWARHTGRSARIVVSDIHPVMLAVAREQTRETPEITVETCDALAPHYPDGSFDIALCTLALHHFSPEDAVRILRGMARVGRRVLVFDLARARLAYFGALA